MTDINGNKLEIPVNFKLLTKNRAVKECTELNFSR